MAAKVKASQVCGINVPSVSTTTFATCVIMATNMILHILSRDLTRQLLQGIHKQAYFIFCFNNCFFFIRLDLPARKNCKKCELKGIFVGAKVVRGYNWEWANQDGGEGILINKLIIFINLVRWCRNIHCYTFLIV